MTNQTAGVAVPDLYYRHSGFIPPAGIAIAALGGAAVGVAGAIAYAYLDLYIPLVYLNCLAAVAFGGLVGFATAKLAKLGKVRNVPFVLAVVLVVTAIAYYFAWVFWINATFDRFVPDNDVTAGGLITSPSMFWDAVKFLNESGTWSMGHGSSSSSSSSKENVSGVFLSVVWLGELVAIFGTALAVAGAMVKEEMFCEPCNRWCGKARDLRRIPVGDSIALKSRLESADYACLESASPAASDHFWSVSYDHCPACKQLHAITVKELRITTDKKGKSKTDEKVVVGRILVHPDDIATVVTPTPPPPPPPPPPPAQ